MQLFVMQSNVIQVQRALIMHVLQEMLYAYQMLSKDLSVATERSRQLEIFGGKNPKIFQMQAHLKMYTYLEGLNL